MARCDISKADVPTSVEKGGIGSFHYLARNLKSSAK